MEIGDIVVRKSYQRDLVFKIIDIKKENGTEKYILKGINIRIVADATESDLEKVTNDYLGEQDKILNSRVIEAIDNAMTSRDYDLQYRIPKLMKEKNEDMMFGRPGKILHVDGDCDYMEKCLKVYRQLSLDAVGRAINEEEQPKVIVDLVKEIKPDIVVITGHDGVQKDTKDYLDVDCYRNSRYYIDSIKALREYNSSYDELVIFAGACQSCYECLLDSGANFTQLRRVD